MVADLLFFCCSRSLTTPNHLKSSASHCNVPLLKVSPFSSIRGAYQLHYYFCFRTRRNKPLLEPDVRVSIEKHLKEIFEYCDFHLLQRDLEANHLRLVVSLRPEHSVAEAIKKIKGNLSRLLCAEYEKLEAGRLWS